MPLIKLADRFSGKKELPVMADVEGTWAIHLTPLNVGVDPNQWTLTHVGCGLAFLSRVPEANARACLAALLQESALDWTLPHGTKSLTAEHRAQGRAFRERFGVPTSEDDAPDVL